MFGYSTKQVRIVVGAGVALIVLGFLIGDNSNGDRAPVSSSSTITTPRPQTPPPQSEATLKVIFVVDGDTVELSTNERVRLIGIDSPESGSPYYSEARNKLIALVLNKEVTLEKDVTETDRYGRLLRYVYVGQTFVNLEMVRSGYATSYRYPPDVKYQERFVVAEQASKTAKLGLWGE